MSVVIRQIGVKILIISLLTIIAGLSLYLWTSKPQTNQFKPIDTFAITAPDQWKEAYGDTDRTQIYFNFSVIVDALNRHENWIRKQDPNMIPLLVPDPNSIKK